jgi:hypothetical protein
MKAIGWLFLILASIVLTVSPAMGIVYVRFDSPGPEFNGNSWGTAYHTIQQGVNAASSGDEVWVAAGTYAEAITLKEGVAVYGGFSGIETSRSQRNWTANVATINGGGPDLGLSVVAGQNGSAIDGFTITNGSCGVSCDSGNMSVTNNTITGNDGGLAFDSTGGEIVGNQITGSIFQAVACTHASPAIRGNTISGGITGISCYYCSPEISRNRISDVDTGLEIMDGAPAIANNVVIARNRAVSIFQGSATVTNNTVTGSGQGLLCWSSTPVVANNIVVFNQSGSFIEYGGPVFRNNDWFGNMDGQLGGIDPLFVNKDAGDYHLRSNSMCIDTGSNTDAPATDMEGRIRPQDGNGDGTAICDMGAYEYPLSLGRARMNYADGSPITFGGMSVTAVFPASSHIYVEQPDRISGVRVDTLEAFSVGQVVNVSGQILTDTATGECYVQASAPWPEPTGGQLPIDPLALKNRLLGGKPYGLQNGITGTIGLNNIGLLVKILGRVTASGTYPRQGISWFYVDDGSGLEDGSGVTGVYVEGALSIIPPEEGAFVAVTGISSCNLYNGNLVNVLLPRSQDDIAVLAPAGGEDTLMLAGSSKTKAPPRLMGSLTCY